MAFNPCLLGSNINKVECLGVLNQSSDQSNFLGYDYGSFKMLFVLAISIVLAILAIRIFIVWIMREFINKKTLDILKERYARGEIDKKEFLEKSRDIKKS